MENNYSLAILKLREKLNVSQHELAKILNVSYPSISRWENGHFNPTKLVKIRVDALLIENNISIDKTNEKENEKNAK